MNKIIDPVYGEIIFDENEIRVMGRTASGVKGINLKDDIVVSGLNFSDKDEYINVFTNRATAKRVKLSDLNSLSRAKRGSTLIKNCVTVGPKIYSDTLARIPDSWKVRLITSF